MSDTDFIDYISQYDLIFLSETWLSPKDNHNLEIQGFKNVHMFGNKVPGARKGRLSGGISVYYRQYYADKIKIIEQIQSGIIWIKVLGDLSEHGQDIYLCHAYMPPVSSRLRKNEDFDFYETLESGIIKYKNSGKVFITGDLRAILCNHQKI